MFTQNHDHSRSAKVKFTVTKSELAPMGRQEPRILSDATDQRGLSATIRKIPQIPLFPPRKSCLFRLSGNFLRALALTLALTAVAFSQHEHPSTVDRPAKLMPGLGEINHPVSTGNSEAQKIGRAS